MHPDILTQIALAIVTATVFAFVAKFTRQPLILGYIAAGVAIGPTEGLGWITPHDIEPIAELGLILLLFMIGLEIDLKKLRQAGTRLAAAGRDAVPDLRAGSASWSRRCSAFRAEADRCTRPSTSPWRWRCRAR